VYEGKYEDLLTDQDQLMLLTYLYTGARKSEVFRLRISSDIDFAAGTIRLMYRKNGGRGWEEVVLPMLNELYDLLLAHVQTYETDFLFVDPKTNGPFTARQHIMEKWCKRAGVRPFVACDQAFDCNSHGSERCADGADQTDPKTQKPVYH
jgi:integrase